jgi:uncharacterized protein YjbJ (UPF0337 family)
MFPAIVVIMVMVAMRMVMAGHLSCFLLVRKLHANQCRDIKPCQKRNSASRFALSLQANRKESFMGSTTDKIKGATNEAVGKAKQGVGEATGSERLQGEGVVQEVKGKGQQAMGDAKDAAKDAIDRAAGAAKRSAD